MSKIKFTAILACSIALYAPFSSNALREEQTKGDAFSGRGSVPSVPSVPATPTSNSADVNSTPLNAAVESNKPTNKEFDEIFSKSLDRINNEKIKALGLIDSKFKNGLEKMTTNNKGEESIQASIEKDLHSAANNYSENVAESLSGVRAHLRDKMQQLNARIQSLNNQATIDSTKKAKESAAKFAKHVEEKSTNYLDTTTRSFTMNALTGNPAIDQLIYNALGGNIPANTNDTVTDNDLKKVVKEHILANAPALGISR